MTFQEFTGKNVEEAIRSAMKEFSADLSDLDIEILSQGSRGILGVGSEEARILAAPKSAVAAAETVREERTVEKPEAREAAEASEPAAVAAKPARRGRGGGRRTEEAPAVSPVEEPVAVASEAVEASEVVEAVEAVEELGPTEADDQVAELARAESERRPRGGRGRGGRGRNGRDRDFRGEERVVRERPERPSREPAPFVSGKALEDLSEEERATLETAKTVLEEMLGLMGLPGTVEIASGGETSRLNVRGDDLGALIGRRGEKLASLQHIVNLIVGRREGQHHRIAVDVENYRGRREQQLRDVADRAAKRVIQSGKIIQLEAMPAVERRVVHMALLENPKVRTQSVGVEPNRRIVVLPAGQVRE
jgi:spoIIIJ-associated protein